jgi:hypothetical protein
MLTDNVNDKIKDLYSKEEDFFTTLLAKNYCNKEEVICYYLNLNTLNYLSSYTENNPMRNYNKQLCNKLSSTVQFILAPINSIGSLKENSEMRFLDCTKCLKDTFILHNEHPEPTYIYRLKVVFEYAKKHKSLEKYMTICNNLFKFLMSITYQCIQYNALPYARTLDIYSFT